jgi:hypothetical protein
VLRGGRPAGTEGAERHVEGRRRCELDAPVRRELDLVDRAVFVNEPVTRLDEIDE